MLNLYSLADTTKDKITLPTTEEADRHLRAITAHDEFLIVYGKLRTEGIFRFLDRARELRPLFSGKQVNKIDLKTLYAPHPGNPKITYARFNLSFAPHDFADLD